MPLVWKKTAFNAPLNHKAYSFEPMQIAEIICIYGQYGDVQIKNDDDFELIFSNGVKNGTLYIIKLCGISGTGIEIPQGFFA